MMEAWVCGERLHLGAEAEVLSGKWFGRAAVQKIRQPRTWRHPDLDALLTKKRMTSEVKLTIKLHRTGVPVPAIWDVDLEKSSIVMQRIEGNTLFEILNSKDYDIDLLKKVGAKIKMFENFNDNRFNIVLACRQSGKSISCVIYILWYALFNPEKTIAILANKGSTAREMLSRITLALENLPFFLQPGCRALNKRSIDHTISNPVN